jgi:hypothetical protein
MGAYCWSLLIRLIMHDMNTKLLISKDTLLNYVCPVRVYHLLRSLHVRLVNQPARTAEALRQTRVDSPLNDT